MFNQQQFYDTRKKLKQEINKQLLECRDELLTLMPAEVDSPIDSPAALTIIKEADDAIEIYEQQCEQLFDFEMMMEGFDLIEVEPWKE